METNEEVFEKALATFLPDLWIIHQALKDNQVDPKIIPFVIKAIGQVGELTGHGSVTLYFVNGEVTNIEPLSRLKVGLKALIR